MSSSALEDAVFEERAKILGVSPGFLSCVDCRVYDLLERYVGFLSENKRECLLYFLSDSYCKIKRRCRGAL